MRPAPLQLPEWTACLVSLTHCEARGATTGCWSLVAWYPPGHPTAKPSPITPQPWFPIRAFVSNQMAATPIPVAKVPADRPLYFQWFAFCLGVTPGARGAPPGGVIHQWGLFPASDLGVRVLLALSGCPSGWGVRSHSWLELASLWDVPILVTDIMSEESSITFLWGFCAFAPAKVLFAGTDALLTTFFRGGSFLLTPWFGQATRFLPPPPRSLGPPPGPTWIWV